MDYPNNYDLPVFPTAGKIAFSRALAIWSLVAFFVMAALAGLLLWTVHSARINPFLISIDSETGEWNVIGEKTTAPKTPDSAGQESLVAAFAKKWLSVSPDPNENEANWCACDRAACETNDAGRCDICCKAADGLYQKFKFGVLPQLTVRANAGETRHVLENSVQIFPVSGISETGGVWRISFKVESNAHEIISVTAFARVAKGPPGGPLTLGYYIADFNAYVTE
ncbi:MAG: hypothetical protein LBK26_00340 [Rickettsiales bacterium]|jgi:hypothetical protein|nr:hypothetical protein [Rickettsiales bacterium]